jgi:glycosyltransferase involved in cell wall biosynthesis/ribosomal protein S18 acetylase RimI-like enzyme
MGVTSGPCGISAVVPVYNGSATIVELVRRLEVVLDGCSAAYEIILVNDGSSDDSWRVIRDCANGTANVVGINLERNFGQHNALLAGIRAARQEVVVTLDDDLQNPPEEIPRLIEPLSQGWDVVYGKPVEKNHGKFRNAAGRLVVHLLGLLGGRSAPMVSSFRAFRRRLVQSFDSYSGPDVSIDGLLTWGTESFTSVPVEHHPRLEGQSNYSLLRLVSHALTMITAFSTKPLRIATTFGFFFTLFGIFVLIYVIGRLLIQGHSVPGFPFLASVISIFSGAQLFALGVIGEYLARMHVRLMSRPSYLIRDVVREGSEADGQGPAEGVACRVLDWDSSYWGFPIGQVTAGRLSSEQAVAARRWALDRGVRCLYLLADSADAETAQAAQEAGFRYVDTRVSLSRKAIGEAPGTEIATGNRPTGNRTDSRLQIRPAMPDEEEKIAEIACASQRTSRFLFDRRFPREKAELFYAEWVRRGMREEDRDVEVATISGEIGGYLICRKSDRELSIELIGVAEGARRQGIAAALVAHAVSKAPPGGVVTTITQARNVAALRLYESAGMRIDRSEDWYHLWQ